MSCFMTRSRIILSLSLLLLPLKGEMGRRRRPKRDAKWGSFRDTQREKLQQRSF